MRSLRGSLRNPTGWNESDVREDFIAPLLVLLGYRRGTDYDVNREGSHALSKPCLFIGRKRIEIDYALMVYRKSFWIIEAKGAEERGIDEQAIFQAYFYAIHPEVAARYFCVTNGWRVQVFDTRTIGADYSPVLDIAKEELPARFGELAQLLGVGRIRAALQDRIIGDIREVLSTEIQEDRLKHFQSSVMRVLQEVKPVVETNRRAVFHKKHQESEDEFRRLAEEGSVGQIIRVMFQFPRNGREFEIVFDTLVRRLNTLSVPDQVTALDNVDRTIRAPIMTDHRSHLTRVALRLSATYDQVLADAGRGRLSDTAAWAVHAVLSKYAELPDLSARAELEGLAYRVFYKASFVEKGASQKFEELAKEARRNLPEEDLVYLMPSAASERVIAVDREASSLFGRYKRSSVGEVREAVAHLEAAERELSSPFQEVFSRGAHGCGDLSFYESYGVPWDYEISGMAGGLLADHAQAQTLLDNRALSLLVGRMKARCQEYAVNHVDCLVARHLLQREQFEIIGDAANFEEVLSRDRVRELASSFRFQKTGRNNDPTETRVRLTAKVGQLEFFQIEGELDLDPVPRLRLLSARTLR
jgi:hypothetical protein